jgi:hypothetical protein
MIIDNNRCKYYIINRKELDIYLLELYFYLLELFF